MAALKTERLVKRFEELTAVDGVDLEINPGEIVGVLGPNGAGKTTLLRMLAGILTPTSGRVVVKGLDLREFPLEAKKEIGFLSGDAQLYQRLTPREALCYFGRLYEIPEQTLTSRIDELIGELEMTSFANRPCRTLSTGQRQRANIARAFLHQPSVVLLDEPTAALDVLSSQFIIKTIRQERATGRAVLLSRMVKPVERVHRQALARGVRSCLLGCALVQFEPMNWKRMLAYVTGSVDDELLARNEYLVTENRILRNQVPGRIRLTDPERISLASAAKRLGRKALEEVAQIVRPETILA